MYLPGTVNASNHLHVVIDVAEWLSDNHRPRTLVLKGNGRMKGDSGRSGLIDNDNVRCSAIEVTDGLFRIGNALTAVIPVIFHDHMGLSSSHLAHIIAHPGQSLLD